MQTAVSETPSIPAMPLWEMIEWINAAYKGAYYDCEFEDGRPVLVACINRDGSEIRIGQIRAQGLV